MQPIKRLKRIIIAIFLIITIVLLGFVAYKTANPPGPEERFAEEPSAAIHVAANCDVTTPKGYELTKPILKSQNTYTLTGDLVRELIVEKSNIVLDGNGCSLRYGLHVLGTTNVTVKDITVEGVYLSLDLERSTNCKVLNATVPNNIYLNNSHDNLVSNCSTGSFYLKNASNNTITNCTTFAFEFEQSNNNSIMQNSLPSVGRSLYFVDSNDNLLFRNDFAKTYWWISMYGSSTHNSFVANNITYIQNYEADNLLGTNTFYHNNFFDFSWNHTAAANSQNVWDNNGQGNYFSSYTGTDSNNDGVGDIPYIIDASNVDNYPLMAPVNIQTEPSPAF